MQKSKNLRINQSHVEIKDSRHFVIMYPNIIILLKDSKPPIRDRFCNIPGIYAILRSSDS